MEIQASELREAPSITRSKTSNEPFGSTRVKNGNESVIVFDMSRWAGRTIAPDTNKVDK